MGSDIFRVANFKNRVTSGGEVKMSKGYGSAEDRDHANGKAKGDGNGEGKVHWHFDAVALLRSLALWTSDFFFLEGR